MTQPAPADRPLSALVLFSGGQDSTTCLADALTRFERVETVGFDYGQRHRVELAQRGVVLQALRRRFAAWDARLGDDCVLDASVLGTVGDSALTREVAIQMQADGLPNTFVPARNLLFLTLAAALAYRRGLQVITVGVSQTDYSGYPDCRHDTMQAMQRALSLGIGQHVVIDTPLMWIDKAATWQLAHALGQRAEPVGGGDALLELIVEHTHTCYTGERSRRHDWGYGCGHCPACQLRADGWRRWRARKV
ncbi:MAG: 7-cyano-7-deazaguanine synthase QueC [Burkholderiaceae bacterium]|jgi:7-cyano-7-deazaguanine synthase|nr:7-cyano-7-deazaguanine synthase QueC [Burkholderiaceae bacterium]